MIFITNNPNRVKLNVFIKFCAVLQMLSVQISSKLNSSIEYCTYYLDLLQDVA